MSKMFCLPSEKIVRSKRKQYVPKTECLQNDFKEAYMFLYIYIYIYIYNICLISYTMFAFLAAMDTFSREVNVKNVLPPF